MEFAMKIVCFVPLKLNNERVPGKNIKAFDNGKPLLSYILKTLKKTIVADDIYVYCSNESIANYLPEGIKYLKRSEHLDQDSTKINEVLQSFAKDIDADIYTLAHATAPFISAESIDKAINAVLNKGYDSALTVEAKQEFLWKNDSPFNYDVSCVPRTQDLEPFYIETTGLYVYKRDLIVNKNRRIGNNPFLVKVSKIEAIDINDPIDFDLANAIACSKLIQE